MLIKYLQKSWFIWIQVQNINYRTNMKNVLITNIIIYNTHRSSTKGQYGHRLNLQKLNHD